MPKHIINLIVLLVCFSLLAYAAKIYFTDPSFYKFGHYRADAVPELAVGTPLFKGAAYCQTCHANRQADWPTGAHKTVECEVCHGAVRQHPDSEMTLIPADLIKLCTSCHEAMPARPAGQPQIVVTEHPFPHTEALQCHTCHNPHSPRIGSPEATVAPKKPAPEADSPPGGVPASAAQCASCHGTHGEGVGPFPALAGKDSTSFFEQMNKYKSGARQNPMMGTIAKSLSDEEITKLAEYYAGLTPEPQQ